MVQNGESAQILSQQNYGNPMIPKITILLWKLNVGGIQFLQVNVPNAVHPFRGCDYPQNNGVVNVVAGKMTSSQNLQSKF
jgi:hypothetical protein